jgi:hypothetical protein
MGLIDDATAVRLGERLLGVEFNRVNPVLRIPARPDGDMLPAIAHLGAGAASAS